MPAGIGDPSNPVRFGGGQIGSTNRELYLEVFGGEVLEAYDAAVIMEQALTVKSVGGGQKAWRFPKTWKAQSEYHTPGVELLGREIQTGEVTITIDDILVSHVGISDIDEMLSHFDVRGPFARTMGHSLAKAFDQNALRQVVLTARDTGDGPFPGGNVIEDVALTGSGSISGMDWVDAIRQANKELYDKDVPETDPRLMVVPYDVFQAIKWVKDSDGNYLVLNRDFNNDDAGGIRGRAERIMVDGVPVVYSKFLPQTDQSADSDVYSKYRGNFSTTTGVMLTPQAVGCVKMMDINVEQTRDTRRLEDFIVTKMLTGLGTLRPEAAVEFRTAAPA